jgi:transcriptional regulator with XRE-family HTH domain
MNIGHLIKMERLRNKLSQEEVAKAIGSTKQAVYKYETGIVTNIPMDKISKMASLFGVTPAYLMGWEESPIETVSGVLGSYELDETQAKLVALYDKIADKEGFIRFTERLSALSEEQQRFVFENLLQGR